MSRGSSGGVVDPRRKRVILLQPWNGGEILFAIFLFQFSFFLSSG